MNLEQILFEVEEHMEKAVSRMVQELRTVRTGMASPALVENLDVEIYGTTCKLRQLALITVPEPRSLLLQPFDVSAIRSIERAIHESRLGLPPVVDGKLIRVFIPELSEQRRRELVRMVKQIAEESRVRIRASRRDALEAAKKLEKMGILTEDELRSARENIQRLTNCFIGQVDKQVETKDAELMKF
ncbi:MAG: ribosome recycling factor [Candidatus Xiphinematobacter sp.]|nr:MAG: ribosome recycling factor [Candidatus Xiphinematobacter sp.]